MCELEEAGEPLKLFSAPAYVASSFQCGSRVVPFSGRLVSTTAVEPWKWLLDGTVEDQSPITVDYDLQRLNFV